MIYEKKGANKAIMLSGIVFAFGSYIILLFLNRIDPQAHAGDFRIMLGLITLISGLIMAAMMMVALSAETWVAVYRCRNTSCLFARRMSSKKE